MLSALLAVIMTIGLIPMGSVTVKAETKNATLSNLGALGTVKIGSKAESDSLIADANSTIASKQKQIQELIADTDEINKRIEMKNREKTDLGI